MKKEAPDFILFDLDGTLWHLPRFVTALAGVMDKVTGFVRKIFGHPAPPPENAPVKPPSFLHRMMYRLLRPRIMEGLDELFEHLRARDIEVGIVSNGPERWGTFLLEQFNIRHHFNVASFRNHGIKPAAAPVLNAVEKLSEQSNETPKKVWLVGDMKSDVKAALNAAAAQENYDVVPVSLGYSPAERKIRGMQVNGGAKDALRFSNCKYLLTYLKSLS